MSNKKNADAKDVLASNRTIRALSAKLEDDLGYIANDLSRVKKLTVQRKVELDAAGPECAGIKIVEAELGSALRSLLVSLARASGHAAEALDEL